MTRFWGWDRYGLPLNNCGLAVPEPRPEEVADPTAAAARNNRKICYDDVIRLIDGILLRQRIERDDAKQLLDWSVKYAIDPDEWPAGAIAHRLDRLCGAGSMSPDAREDLKRLLADMAGDPEPSVAEPAAIPFTEPVPPIHFTNRQFVFCGYFVSGVDACIENLWSRGGSYAENVTAQTNYLVVGALRSQEWVSNSVATEVATAWNLSPGAGSPPTQVDVIGEASFLRAISECQVTNPGGWRPAPGIAKAGGMEWRETIPSGSPARHCTGEKIDR